MVLKRNVFIHNTANEGGAGLYVTTISQSQNIFGTPTTMNVNGTLEMVDCLTNYNGTLCLKDEDIVRVRYRRLLQYSFAAAETMELLLSEATVFGSQRAADPSDIAAQLRIKWSACALAVV